MIEFNLGSHNSLTYLKPKHWWMSPFSFMSRCQRRNYREQYKAGVRLFDIRLWYTKSGDLEIRHGVLAYQFNLTDLAEFMDFLSVNNDCWLRVILEETYNGPMSEINEGRFIETCKDLEKYWPRVRIFGGQRKYDWKQLYTFRSLQPNLVDKYSSTTSLFGKRFRILDDIWPWLYAKLKNSKNIQEFISDKSNKRKWLFIDFI